MAKFLACVYFNRLFFNSTFFKSLLKLTKKFKFALWAHLCGWPQITGRLSSQRPAMPLRWRHNGRDSVSNHQPHDCLLNRLLRRRSKKTSKLRVTGPCAGNSPGTGEFPAQMAGNAENVSIWWRHHGGKRFYVIRPPWDATYHMAMENPSGSSHIPWALAILL